MDINRARRKWEALRNMTTERGCSAHEAASAKKLADVLAAKYGFNAPRAEQAWRSSFDARFYRAERRAAIKWKWEYRRCSKSNCHCARGGNGHGPYKYAKRRTGKLVRSIYIGK